MSALVLATKRTAQPQGAAPIDWGTPLTRGLSFALSGIDGRDRVSGGAITRTASLSTGVTRHGFGFSSAANSAFSRALDLSGTSEITVSFVLVLRASTTAVLVEHTPTYNTNAGSFLVYTDGGNFFAGVSNGGGGVTGYNVSQCAAPALNTTVRVVVTLRRLGTTAKACRIWFNGVEQATTQPNNGAISGNFANSTTYFLGRGASSLFANAIIQDPAIFSRALSDSEVATLSRSPWQLFKPIDRRIWVPTISGGLTQLLSSQELNFKLRDSLSSQLASVFKVRMFAENSLTHNYSVLNGVFKQQSVDYNLRGLITDNVELNYIIKGIVQDNLTSSYNIRSSVQDSSFIDYKVRSTCLTSEVFSYSLRTLVSLDSVFSYNINTSGQIQSSRLIQYKVRSNVDKSTGFSWHTRSIETSPLGLIYNIKGSVQGSLEEFTYKIYSNIGSDQELKYKVKGLISKEVPFSYIVLGLTQVKKDFPLLYVILSAIQPDWTEVYVKSDSVQDVYIKSDDTFVVFLK